MPVPWIESENVAKAVIYPASDKPRSMIRSSLVLDAGLLTADEMAVGRGSLHSLAARPIRLVA